MGWTAKEWWFPYQHEQEIIFFSKASISAMGPNQFPIQGIMRLFLSSKVARMFKVCKFVHHHTIQINQPTRCNNFSSLLLDVYVQLNMFRASSRPSSGAQQLQAQPLLLLLERGGSSAVGRGRASQPNHDQQHCYHHAPTVKPEAAFAVVELLMMGIRMPETC
jgi:hypothetical protein